MTDTLTPTPDLAEDQGQWHEIDGGYEIRFERRLRHSPQRVWAALTTPQGLACWLAEAVIDPRPGGHMDLNFRQPATEKFPDTPEVRRQANEVLVFQPFTRFEHTFGGVDSVVSWRLAPDGDGTRLTLIHRMPRDWESNIANTLAGWHHHMEGLDDAARGAAHPWRWPRWTALRDAYAAAVAGNRRPDMTTTPFLMFQNGQCAPALDFYLATLPETRILSSQPYPPERPAATA